MNTRRAGIDELLANPPEYENHQTSQLTQAMAIRVVELSKGGYKIRKIFAYKSTYPKEIIEIWELD